jgi:carbamoyltransferase
LIILGISAYYHDSAAALVVDGDIAAAAQEERFSRIKHDSGFPVNAVDFCLKFADIKIEDVDYLVFYDKPMQKFDRLLETYLAFAPQGFFSFAKAIPLWLKQKINIRREIKKELKGAFKGKILFTEHHESHAASAFFPSPYEEAAILTIDGVGEWASASIGKGSGNKIEILEELHFPHSLGLLYSAFTYFTGFKVNSGEYKLMGLAPYGKPVYADIIKEYIMDIKDDGSVWLDMSYFNYCQGLTMTSEKFHKLFGGPPRKPEAEISKREMDLAASIQVVTEEVMLKMAENAKKITGSEYLCMAGGVALNCVGNGKIIASDIFKDAWIQPAAGDAGGALGAALFAWHQLLDKERKADNQHDKQKGSFLGCEFKMEEIEAFLKEKKAKYHVFENEEELLDKAANCIAAQKVVGWFCGRMEFGPRALGARSIIGDARSEEMQTTMNLKIKYRESFRPFAPCVLREDVDKYFEMEKESPYMLVVAPVKENLRAELSEEQKDIMLNEPNLCERVKVPRSSLPAITHMDYSARVQTVDPERHGRYCRLMEKFREITGSSVIINTSFNIRGEPIVCAPSDAYKCFMNTEMDVLVLENAVLYKEEQSERSGIEKEKYKSAFKLD